MVITIDKKIHEVFDYFTGKEIIWNNFQEGVVDGLDQYYDYYYADDCLYVIRDKIFKKYHFIQAKSPEQALIDMDIAIEKAILQQYER